MHALTNPLTGKAIVGGNNHRAWPQRTERELSPETLRSGLHSSRCCEGRSSKRLLRLYCLVVYYALLGKSCKFISNK